MRPPSCARSLALAAVGLVGLLGGSTAIPSAQSKTVGLPVLQGVTLTVLSENMVGEEAAYSAGHQVLAEWGFAVLVEADGHRILFDTGAGHTLAPNARELNVDISKLDAIVLSHAHGDHTQGLKAALELAGKVDVFLHPAAFDTVFWKDGSRAVPITMPLSRTDLAQRARHVVETKGPTLVANTLMVTGAIPRLTDFEDTGITGRAFRDEAMTMPDTVAEDQAIVFRTQAGSVVLVGCAHAGLINTLNYVARLTGDSKIYAVVGGTHLLTASPARMKKTEDALRQCGVQRIMVAHCTGLRAYGELSRAFPGQCSWPGAGTRIVFGK